MRDAFGRAREFERAGPFVGIKGAKENEHFEARYKARTARRLESAELGRCGGPFWGVPGLLTAPEGAQGAFHRASGDVVSLEALEAPCGKPVEVLGYRQNMIMCRYEGAGPLKALGVEYVMPFKFAIFSQRAAKTDGEIVLAHTGAAACSYPDRWGVAEGDVITALSARLTRKIVAEKARDGAADILPDFFADRVDFLETGSAGYAEGRDFVLCGTNRLVWLGERKPEGGEAMSVAYRYHPTYRVSQSLPAARTAKNQRLPRKAELTLLGAFSEARGVNSQRGAAWRI